MKFLNCLFLIIGTAIGTGILAVPVVNPQAGFYSTIMLISTTWLFMTIASFMLLRAVLAHKQGIDLINITRKKLGDFWQVVVGGSYLLLLYALLAVYILVGSAWLDQWTGQHLLLTDSQYQMVFTLICASFIYLGVHFVGGVNQLLSAGVIITLCIVITLGMGDIHNFNLLSNNSYNIQNTSSVIVTAFGFAVILPTLSSYTKRNHSILKKSLLIGSIIILLLNILWVTVCFGVLGKDALTLISGSNSEGPEIILALQNTVKNPLIGVAAGYFAVFALFSSLIGVSLSLYHFIIDSFKLRKTKFCKINGIALTFTVPLLTLLIQPSSFIAILGFAGIFVSVVLGILPAMLEININKKSTNTTDVIFRYLAYLTLLFFITVIIVEISKYFS
ncbi:MAG: aromatic amino acid transport family protein [Rickettsiales bacterium]